jgi:hypothetical protein
MVRPKVLHPLSEGPPELQHSKEFLKKHNSAIVRQPPVITGDFDVSWQTHHVRPDLTEG